MTARNPPKEDESGANMQEGLPDLLGPVNSRYPYREYKDSPGKAVNVFEPVTYTYPCHNI